MSTGAIQGRHDAQWEFRQRLIGQAPDAAPALDARVVSEHGYGALIERVRDVAVHRHPDLWRDPAAHQEAIIGALREAIAEIATRDGLSAAVQDEVLKILHSQIFGYGLVDVLMRDDAVTELIIDGPDSVGYLKNGEFFWLTDDFPGTSGHRVTFESDGDLRAWLERLTRKSERSLNESNPLLDDDMENGERLNATAPPVSEHITVNIRKSVAQTHAYTPEEYIAQGVWSADMARFMMAAVRGKANIIVAGPTNSGKTTVIRMLLEHGVSARERVISIEDIRETNAKHPRFLSLMTVDRDKNPVTFTALFATSMRKTPDRVMVSELRGPHETVAYFQTIASGHDGAITSQHGKTPTQIVTWLVARAIQGGLASIPDLVTDMVYDTLELLVFIRPIGQGRRRITGIYELVPPPLQVPGQPKFRPLFEWDRRTDTHQWVNDALDYHIDQWEFNEEGIRIPRRPPAEG